MRLFGKIRRAYVEGGSCRGFYGGEKVKERA